MNDDLLARSPINGNAARVVSQCGCVDDADLNREQVLDLIEVLRRQRSMLADRLGIQNRTQKKNLMYRYNKRHARVSGHPQPMVLREYISLGKSLERLHALLRK